jgi:hypothetical protein
MAFARDRYDTSKSFPAEAFVFEKASIQVVSQAEKMCR